MNAVLAELLKAALALPAETREELLTELAATHDEDAAELAAMLDGVHAGECARAVSAFDIWVGENNPDEKLEYGKGFWDYVEILRRMIDKFAAAEARVIGTYVVHTPPPEEELPMPAVAFRVRGVTFALKHDFGARADSPYEWTVTVVRPSPYLGPVFGLLEPELDLSRTQISGFPPELTCPGFRASPASFTCRLVDEWDVATLIRLASHEA